LFEALSNDTFLNELSVKSIGWIPDRSYPRHSRVGLY